MTSKARVPAAGKTPDAVRQIAHRAREHVAARRQQRAVLEKFLAAVSTGDVQALMEVLAPDVVAIADGGGIVPASRKPITGAEKLAALLARAAKIPGFVAKATWLNGMPGVRLAFEGATAAVSLVVEDGRITRIYAITNPHKLGRLETVAELRG